MNKKTGKIIISFILLFVFTWPKILYSQEISEKATIIQDKILVPNAFSPNDDGINDVFKIFMKHDVLLESMIIINRYGEIVFETKNPNQFWDGKYKGIESTEGSYTYLIAFFIPGIEGIHSKKGTITLFR